MNNTQPYPHTDELSQTIFEASKHTVALLGDVHEGRITPDEFRAGMRKVRADFGDVVYERARVIAIAGMAR